MNLLWLALLSAPAWAQSELDAAWARLQDLAAAGYPDVAAAQVMVALLEHPDAPDAARTRLRLAAFQGAVGHRRAQDHVLDVGQRLHPDLASWFAASRVSAAFVAGELDLALAVPIPEQGPAVALDAVHLLRAHARLGAADRGGAHEELAKVVGPLGQTASAFDADLERWDTLPRRSPALAGALSLAPGLGQAYAGNVGGGLLAAGIVGGSAVGAVHLVRRDQPGAAVAVASLGAAVWTTTWRAAVSQARARNGRLREQLRADEWADYGVHFVPEPTGAPLRVEVGGLLREGRAADTTVAD